MSPAESSSNSSPLRCSLCSSAEVTSLAACPECCGVFCIGCLAALPKATVCTRVECSEGDCSDHGDGHVAGFPEISAPCPSCKRRVEFREVCCVSAVAKRLCGDIVAGSGAVSLQCVVCGERAFNNRTCPSCAVVYCSICLDQWRAQCSAAGEDSVSCANCRSIYASKEFTHDRFAAKLARVWPQQEPLPQQALSPPKARRRKVKRTPGRPDDCVDDGLEEITDSKPGWASSNSGRATGNVVKGKTAMMFVAPTMTVALFFLFQTKEVPFEEVRQLSELAVFKDRQGDAEGALEAYIELRRIRGQQGLLYTIDDAMLLHNIGVTKGKQGDAHGALEAYNDALAIRERTGTLNTTDGAHLLYNIGVTRGVLRDEKGALRAYDEARRIRKATNTLQTPEGLDLLRAWVMARSPVGDYDKEAEEEMRRVLQYPGMLKTVDGAMLLHNVGVTKGKQGDVSGALQAYQDARKIREKLGTLETPDGAHLLYNMGVTKVFGGDISGGIEAYELAYKIRERTHTLDSREGHELVATLQRTRNEHAMYAGVGGGDAQRTDAVMALFNIGVAKGNLGDLWGALEAYTRARDLRTRYGTLENEDGANLLFHIGFTQGGNGDLDKAIEAYAEAWRIHRRIGTESSKQGLLVMRTLAYSRGQRGDAYGEHEVLEAIRVIQRSAKVKKRLDEEKPPT